MRDIRAYIQVMQKSVFRRQGLVPFVALIVLASGMTVSPLQSSATAPANVTYTSCSTQEITKLEQTMTELLSISSQAVNYFNNNRGGQRYVSYFGTVTNIRWTSVRNNVTALNNAFLNSPLRFNCSRVNCGAGTYGYVYPTQHDPYEVFLCDAFFAAPTSGTDSSAGTLVHEISHFVSIASTSDYVYGKSSAQSLAVSNVGQAIQNADNYEYFFEDNPTTSDNASAYTLSGSTVSFGNQINGTVSNPATTTLTNTGDAVLTIGAITSSTNQFSLGGSCQNTSIAPNQSCTITATFAPSTFGVQSANISITNNAPISVPAISLSGTATAASATTTLAPTTTSVPTTTTVPPSVGNNAVTSTTVAPTLPISVSVRAVSSASKLTITLINNPTGTKRAFAVEKKVGSRWITQGAKKTISNKPVTIDFSKGSYRVRLLPNATNPGITSNSATLKK